MKNKAFSLRMPEDLDKQIEMRARLSRRSKNAQIIHMLETLIDHQVQADRSAFPKAPTSSGL